MKLAESLNKKNSYLENTLESYNITLSILDELRSMGMGLKELKRLHDHLSEINRANGFSAADGFALQKLIDHIDSDYDAILGFKAKVRDQRRELINLRNEINIDRAIHNALRHIDTSLGPLLRRSVREDQIVRIANLLEDDPTLLQSTSESEVVSEAPNGTQEPLHVSSPLIPSLGVSSTKPYYQETDFNSSYKTHDMFSDAEITRMIFEEDNRIISEIIAMQRRAISDKRNIHNAHQSTILFPSSSQSECRQK